ncbi:MAG TPA: RDD family protein [Candidatus Deferrimicrobiaceae bacterium]|nr:RDD family protein [Candidatus Deferrimicrobiaceae bacterium]
MAEEFTPADWQTRSLAFLIDLIVYLALFYGLGGFGHFLAMLYILFRDGIFAGQSIGKKIMGIQAVHTDGRAVHFVDSSFRNVLFLFYVVFPVAIVVETIALMRNPEHRRLGDRIAKTQVVRKEAVPVLA